MAAYSEQARTLGAPLEAGEELYADIQKKFEKNVFVQYLQGSACEVSRVVAVGVAVTDASVIYLNILYASAAFGSYTKSHGAMVAVVVAVPSDALVGSRRRGRYYYKISKMIG